MNFIPFSVIHLTMIRGGDKRDRTADLLRARQALSQLSYIPIHHFITAHSLKLSGGSEWTWTTDLTLIRGAL